MSTEKELQERSGSKCELCTDTNALMIYKVSGSGGNANEDIFICGTCSDQIENPERADENHWRCLNDCMWSEVPAVQVIAWRMLNRLRGGGWSQDLIDMMYFDDERLLWAQESGDHLEEDEKIIHKDSNGAVLKAGDSVVLIKSLNVKGSSLIAKRGTTVRGISLVTDNASQIEGRVEGQQIVILTEFVKKSS